MSSCDRSLSSPIEPVFHPKFEEPRESAKTQQIIESLHLQKHPEGGYFVETDRDPQRIPNPFLTLPPRASDDRNSVDTTRNTSTTIYYLISPGQPKGSFHRNKGRTVHTLHRGRGRYVIIHADKAKGGEKAPVETFIVGHDIAKGERLQWIVEGGKYKASYLLPDEDGKDKSEGLLISEVCLSIYLSLFA